jgi:hypothetical protein
MAARKLSEGRPLTPLGERIMAAAVEAGFTQSSLERAAKFSGGYLTKLLYRPQDRIELSKLETLTDLLGCRMHWLATGRAPMREGGPRSAVEEAMVTARRYAVTEDVFWFVRTKAVAEDPVEAASRPEGAWLEAFLAENKKRVEDAQYAREAKRVSMNEAKRKPPPPSEPRRKPRTRRVA